MTSHTQPEVLKLLLQLGARIADIAAADVSGRDALVFYSAVLLTP